MQTVKSLIKLLKNTLVLNRGILGFIVLIKPLIMNYILTNELSHNIEEIFSVLPYQCVRTYILFTREHDLYIIIYSNCLLKKKRRKCTKSRTTTQGNRPPKLPTV